ncbi:MAG: acyl-CoA dehydrogenase family protein [Candidatus Aenigmatarchaeota archaeon]
MTGDQSVGLSFELSEDQITIRDTAREFAKKRIAPNAGTWDDEGTLPKEIQRELAEAGYFGASIPEKHGGAGLDPVAYGLMIEELSAASASVGVLIAVQLELGAYPILAFGTEEQKKRYLVPMAAGEFTAYCLTEPESGTDAESMRMVAVPDGNGNYILTGTKQFITGAAYAKRFIVFAKLPEDKAPADKKKKRVCCFVVEADANGVELGEPEKKLGLKASDTRQVILTDCVVSEDCRIGEEGEGWKIAMATMDHGRLGIGWQSLGIAKASRKTAIEYAQTRKQFGRPICDFQMIQLKLAEMDLLIDSAELLLHRAATMAGNGVWFKRQASQAKLHSSRAARWVSDQAIQILGGYGYCKEYPAERYFRDARITGLYEGTDEIQIIIIATQSLTEFKITQN